MAQATTDTTGFFDDYRPLAGVYDEMVDAQGAMRPAWRELANLLGALGTGELDRRWEQARRVIHENGVTYNVHGDPQGRDRRWELDALPWVMDPAEWSTLSAGLAQRAALLNAILADVYGPQRLLRERIVPPELVLGQSGFLRPAHGWSVPHHRYLHLYASHLVRSPDGHWCVVADRAETPVGAGYAVENRIVISRMIPHVFHHCRIQRLAGFFLTLRESMRELAARNRDNPHIVLLSPGPASPTYFEDSYLARYLGYTLVEGEDLTVRDNRVFLKTLGGLVGVDVVLRRVGDVECDPLELDGHSRCGVAGLVHAARRGNVVLANALGSGLVESPTLMAFLPAICRRLLGEPLALASVRTWWCGDRQSLAYVLKHLDELVVRPAFGTLTIEPVQGAALGQSQAAELVGRIKAAPERFVAQELVPRSTAPVWDARAARPGHMALRMFAVASNRGYQVMSGALAHSSAQLAASNQSLFIGHGSKDVWVQAEGAVAAVTLLQPPGTPIPPRRSGNDLPSRVADSLFWLGRHVERAEASARLLRSILARLVGEVGARQSRRTDRVVACAGRRRGAQTAVDAPVGNGTLETLALEFLHDAGRPTSLHNMLAALARVATVVRDRISLDTWRILKRIDNDFQPRYPLGVSSLADALATLNQMILNFSALAGVAMENMTRGPGWQFFDLGRRIERALSSISLMRVALFIPGPSEHGVFEALLEIADSSMTYRNRYATNLQLGPLIDLLVTDETNPRSIAYQLVALADHVEHAPRQQSEALLSDEQKTMIAVLSRVRLADLAGLGEVDETGVRRKLDTFLHELTADLGHFASQVSHKYLVHAGPAHQLSEVHRD